MDYYGELAKLILGSDNPKYTVKVLVHLIRSGEYMLHGSVETTPEFILDQVRESATS